MKKRYDNSKVMEENTRSLLTQGIKKGGNGRFTWGKSVVFLVVFTLVIIYTVLVYRDAKTEKITQEQWVDMLADSFGIVNVEDLNEESDEIADGRYVAETVMKVVGRNNLAYLSGKDILSDADLIKLADEYDIVDKRLINKKLTKDDALSIIRLAEEFYYDPNNYPEYYEAVYKDSVIDSSKIELISYNDKTNTATVCLESEEIVGKSTIILEVEPEIYKGFNIVSYNSDEEGIYEVELAVINDLSDVIEYIDFSGTVDFSSVFYDTAVGSIKDDSVENKIRDSRLNSEYKIQSTSDAILCTLQPMVLAANVNTPILQPIMLSKFSDYFTKGYWSDNAKAEREAERLAKKEEKEQKKAEKAAKKAAEKEAREDKKAINKNFLAMVDLEMGGEIKSSIDNEGISSYSYSQYATFSTNKEDGGKTSAKYDISVDNKGNMDLYYTSDNSEFDGKKENDSDNSVSYKVNISDLKICGATYFQATDWDDEKNYVDFRISGDAEVEGTVHGSIEGKFLIFEKSFPIPVTAGTVSVCLKFYIVVTSDGDIHMTYEIENVHSSVFVSQKGVDVDAGVNDTNFDVYSKIKLNVGPDIEVVLSVFGFNVVNPNVEVRVVASVETLMQNEGFEEYPKCVQSLIAGPTLKVALIRDDSLLYNILDQFGLDIASTYIMIDEQNAPFRSDLHFETELDGTSNMLIGKASDVCTHIKIEEPEESEDIEENSDLEDAEDLEALMEGAYFEDFDDVEDNEVSEDSVNAEDIEDFENEKNNYLKGVVVEKINEIKMKMDNKVDEIIKEVEEVLYKSLEDWLYRNCGSCY